jgi:hypothetical protein
MEVSCQIHAPTTLPQGKSSWYPFDRRPDEPQSRSGRGGEEKNSEPLPGLEPPIIQSIAQRYTTELSRLFPSSPRSSKWSFPQGLPTKILYAFFSLVRATYPTNHSHIKYP